MDRASGRYKRRTQLVVLALSFAVAASLNADAFAIASRLYREPGLRAALVAHASRAQGPTARSASDAAAAAAAPAGGASGDTAGIRRQLEAIPFPLGYPAHQNTLRLRAAAAVNALPGLLVSTVALSLGTPFWFDLLNKLMVIRATVKPREKSRDEGSEDRASPAAAGVPAGIGASTPPPVGAVAAGFPPQQFPAGPAPVGTLGDAPRGVQESN